MAVYAVPSDKILVLSKEDGEIIFKAIRESKMSPAERERIRKRAKKLRQKPEKKKDE